MDTEMQRGMLPGAMALSAKFVPVVQRVSQKTLEAVKDFVADPKALSEKVSRGTKALFLYLACLRHVFVDVSLLLALTESMSQLLLFILSRRSSSGWCCSV